jgi:hypothetical protein
VRHIECALDSRDGQYSSDSAEFFRVNDSPFFPKNKGKDGIVSFRHFYSGKDGKE